jgi:hypothetical protein
VHPQHGEPGVWTAEETDAGDRREQQEGGEKDDGRDMPQMEATAAADQKSSDRRDCDEQKVQEQPGHERLVR